MNKLILASTVLAMSAIGHDVFAGNAYPTNGLFQEMAGTISTGTVSIDLVNTSNFRDYVRVGLSTGGEALYATHIRGAGDMVGYKHLINRSMAAYGLISFDSADDDTETLFGMSYSGSANGFVYNVNAEMFSPGGDADSTMEIKAGVYYSMRTRYAGRIRLAAEYIMNTDDDTSSINALVRFAPNSNFRIDVGVYESIDNGGGGASDSSTGIPLFFRLNFRM
jgi:hypothetical protein